MEAEAPYMTVVAAAVVRDGRVLVVRRAPGQKLEGKWEFPGGKVEPGETDQAALEREMLEELGVTGRTEEFVGESVFPYAFGEVLLKLYRFGWHSGDMRLTVHDRLKWVVPGALAGVDFAPADAPLATRLMALMSTGG
jgi:8-oxo-dGTP diphosphatase